MPRNLLTGGAMRSKLFSELLNRDAPAPVLEAGARVGVWRIERLLGRGGMSEVYLAHREDRDFEQTVAIKVIAAELDAVDLLRAERRHLGRLRHPGIAALIDGGELDSGEVWLAMDYVVGQAIDTYAEERALDWAARVALVEQLCAAVGHAHMHLLVHRDIKPSNVLVDGSGHARLIDFGIAIAVEAGATMPRWHTPGYAAPEQLQGRPLTTTTDIFQLGRLLSALTSEDVLPAPIPAAARQDLRAVIARATDPDPTRRHASAAALAADLAALQALRPLPHSGLLQRMRLWRLRHAWVPWVAAPLLVLFALMAVGATRSALREAEERDLALREEQVSTAIGSFFIDLFNEPVGGDGGTDGIQAVLDRGQLRLRERPHPVPEVQAGLLSQLAEANVQMERRDVAVELLEEAIRVQRGAGQAASLAHSLATLARLRTLAGDEASGARLAAEATRLLDTDSRPGRDRFLALTKLGEYHASSFGYSPGERALRAAIEVGRQRYGEQSPELYRSERLLLELLRNQWRIDEAEPLAAALTARCERAFGQGDSRCVVEFIHWQRMRALAGRPAEARRALEALWAGRDGWDGALRSYRSHALLYGLSEVLAIEGDYFAALDTVQDSLCELIDAEGRGGLHWTLDRGGLALQLLDVGAVEEALAVSSETGEQLSAAAATSLTRDFWALRHAGIELARAGAVTPGSEADLRGAVERIRAVFGERSHFAARAEYSLARVEAALGNLAAAHALVENASRAEAAGLHYYHPQLLAEIDTLRAALSSDEAERVGHLRRAEKRLRASHGDGHVLVAAAALRRARAESAAGLDVDEAATLRALEALAAQQVSGSALLRDTRAWLLSLGIVPPASAAGRSLAGVDPVCD